VVISPWSMVSRYNEADRHAGRGRLRRV
jgi:hypothetical protein